MSRTSIQISFHRSLSDIGEAVAEVLEAGGARVSLGPFRGRSTPQFHIILLSSRLLEGIRANAAVWEESSTTETFLIGPRNSSLDLSGTPLERMEILKISNPTDLEWVERIAGKINRALGKKEGSRPRTIRRNSSPNITRLNSRQLHLDEIRASISESDLGGGRRAMMGFSKDLPDEEFKVAEKPLAEEYSSGEDPPAKEDNPDPGSVDKIKQEKGTEEEVKEPDKVDFSLYARETVSPGDTSLFQIAIHLPEKVQEAIATIRKSDSEAQMQTGSTLEFLPGSVLGFRLEIPELLHGLKQNEKYVVWERETSIFQFLTLIPKDQPEGPLRGRVLITVEGVLRGRMNFEIQVSRVPAEGEGKELARFQPYEFAFVSYARKDWFDKVGPRVQMIERSGMKYFRDERIKSGEEWEKSIQEALEKADLIYLFWSENAKESTWVENEIKYVWEKKLKKLANPPELRPIIMEDRYIAPWAWLQHLQFTDNFLAELRPPATTGPTRSKRTFVPAPPGLPSVSKAEMIEVDRLMVEKYGIDLPRMMENAGAQLSELARDYFLGGDVGGKSVIVLAGSGGNGGGALVAARRLHIGGAKVQLYLSKNPAEMKAVPLQQLKMLQNLGLEAQNPYEGFPEAELILDGLIGYSLRGNPDRISAALIQTANDSGIPILSLDAPSGLEVDSGKPASPCIKATATMTLALPKTGFFRLGGKQHIGDLFLADISVPTELYEEMGLREKSQPIFRQGQILKVKMEA